MLDCENIMLIGLVSIIIIIVVLIYQNTQSKQVAPSISNNLVENFETDMDSESFNLRNLNQTGESYKEKVARGRAILRKERADDPGSGSLGLNIRMGDEAISIA